jgi:predicted NACHT family NTPase
MFLVTVETLYIIILVSKKRTDLKKSAYKNLPQKLKNYKPNIIFPHHLAQKWIKNGQIIPLLDGLDEVVLQPRRMCLDVINTYRREHYLDPLGI